MIKQASSSSSHDASMKGKRNAGQKSQRGVAGHSRGSHSHYSSFRRAGRGSPGRNSPHGHHSQYDGKRTHPSGKPSPKHSQHHPATEVPPQQGSFPPQAQSFPITRTNSAPPNLKEQERAGPMFMPAKSYITFNKQQMYPQQPYYVHSYPIQHYPYMPPQQPATKEDGQEEHRHPSSPQLQQQQQYYPSQQIPGQSTQQYPHVHQPPVHIQSQHGAHPHSPGHPHPAHPQHPHTQPHTPPHQHTHPQHALPQHGQHPQHTQHSSHAHTQHPPHPQATLPRHPQMMQPGLTQQYMVPPHTYISPPAAVLPKPKKSNRVAIIDPDTGEEISLSGKGKSSSVSPDAPLYAPPKSTKVTMTKPQKTEAEPPLYQRPSASKVVITAPTTPAQKSTKLPETNDDKASPKSRQRTVYRPKKPTPTDAGDAARKAQEQKRKAEDLAKKKAEEERIRKESEKRRKEEEARKKAEEEAKRKAEEEAKRKAEEEAKRKAEEEASRKAEQEAREVEAKRKAEEARRIAEEEAKKKVEARKKAEDEKRRKVEAEAKKKAEEARLKAEEAKKKTDAVQKKKAEETSKPQPSGSKHPTAEDDDWESKDETELLDLEKSVSRPSNNMSGLKSANVVYPEGSWRPDNTTGKRIYDRDFLMKFKDFCTDVPEGLPSITNIIQTDDKPQFNNNSKPSQNSAQWGRNQGQGFRPPRVPLQIPFNMQQNMMPPPGMRPGMPPFMVPHNMRLPMNAHMNFGMRPMPHHGMKMGKGNKPQVVLPHGVKPLEQTENRWKRPTKHGATEKEKEELMFRKVNGLLNKITPEKFDRISSQLIGVGITSLEYLRGVIQLIFEKAIAEPKFSEMYARLCQRMAKECPVFKGADGKNQNFKRVLLNRCQEEFEYKPKIDPDNDNEATREERATKMRRRMLGNIKFIGELYNLGMLTEKIMHNCIKRLLGDIKKPAPEDIEGLCKLLSTIGKALDHNKAKAYMDEYFHRMQDLAKNKSLDSRIRFMLLDVIDLRINKWVPRRKKLGPTTINAVHQEAEAEKQKNRMIAASLPIRGRALSSHNMDSNRNRPVQRHSQSHGQMARPMPILSQSSLSSGSRGLRPSTDGWKNVSGKKTFGPGGSSFSGGARGWNSAKSNTDTNKSSPTPKLSPSKSKQSSSSNMYSALASPPVGRPTSSSGSKKPSKPAMTQELLEKKSEEILAEYASSSELEEAITCVKELKLTSQHTQAMISHMIMLSLEKKEVFRQALGQLLLAFHKEKLITSDNFKQAIRSLLDETLADLCVDAPMAPAYIAQYLVLAIGGGFFDLAALPSALVELKDFPHISQKIITKTVLELASTNGEAEARDMYRKSKLNLKDYLPRKTQDDYIVFLDRQSLSFLEPTLKVEKELTEKINSLSTQDLLEWIKGSQSNESLVDPVFTRNLVSKILDKIGKDNTSKGNLDITKTVSAFGETEPTLKHCVTPFPSAQLACLFAVQNFAHTAGRAGLIVGLFEELYGREIIAYEVFKDWSSDTKDTTPGKGDCLFQVNSFLNKIKEEVEGQEQEEDGEEGEEEEEGAGMDTEEKEEAEED